MKKRIIAMLCICISLLTFVACGADQTKVDYNGYTYEELEKNSLDTWKAILELDLAKVETYVANIDAMPETKQIAFYEANEGAKEQVELFRGWINASKEAGTYIGVNSFNVTMSGKSTTADLILDFEGRDVIFTMVYKNYDMSVEGTTVDVVYTTGEKVEKALLNTVLGMGTVFVMLIVICLIISCFSIIPKIEKKLADKKQKKNTPATEADVTETVTEDVSQTDDLELVAVIAAAIAAYTGQSTDDFVVRSIKRR